ncbi:MAG: Futalosine hydrolase [Desulfovibrio sp.]
MADALIVFAATAMEMRAVLEGAGLDIPSPEKGGVSFAGIRGVPVHLAVTGVGPLAAAHMAGKLAGQGFFTAAKCRGALNFGIAGTYSPFGAPLGSVVLANREIWPEYGVRTAIGVDAEKLGFPLRGKKTDLTAVWDTVPLDPEAALQAMGLFSPHAAPELPENPRVTVGGSVTVAGVSGTAAIAGDLAGKYAALTENMEGFPLALAAMEAGVPFAEVRAISNIVGERSAAAWNIPASLAALSRAAALIFAGQVRPR